jgi:hypothetical protein
MVTEIEKEIITCFAQQQKLDTKNNLEKKLLFHPCQHVSK